MGRRRKKAAPKRGWTEELKSLDDETSKLLRECRGDEAEEVEEKPVVETPVVVTKKKKKKKRAEKKQSPPDEAPVPPFVPKDRHPSLGLVDPAEAACLDFGANTEQRRTLEEDQGASALGVRLRALRLERERLATLDKAKAERAVEAAFADLERTSRKFALHQDVAAVAIQRIARGTDGRHRAAVRKEEVDLAKEIDQRWVQVRDTQTGDKWFYNTLTKESQWESPDALDDVVPTDAEVVTLPPVTSPTKSPPKTIKPENNQTEEAMERPTTASSLREEARRDIRGVKTPEPGSALYDGEDQPMCPEETSLVVAQPATTNLVRPDGTFDKPQLRQAVAATLALHKFDSIQALLDDANKKRKAKKATFLNYSVATGAVHKDARDIVYGDDKRQYMAAMPLLGGDDDDDDEDRRRGSRIRRRSQQQQKLPRNLAIRDVAHPGFEKREPEDDEQPKNRRICFVCWSAGRKNCAFHRDPKATNQDETRASESVLMCQNWDLNKLRDKYRSEDIQEVHKMMVKSTRYDKNKRTFVTTMEPKHPIYREVYKRLREFNFTMRRRWHTWVCIKSIVEEVRCGKLAGTRADAAGKILQLKGTMKNRTAVRRYTKEVQHLHPKAPKTGTSWAETHGKIVVLRKKDGTPCVENEDGDIEFDYVESGPKPIPVAVYQARAYPLPAPRTIPLPEPSYPKDKEFVVVAQNTVLDEAAPAAWLERVAKATARDAARNAMGRVSALSPVTGMELLRRTKYPPLHTVKFATFHRKATPGNVAVGGLPAYVTINQLIQTVIPPQFGDYTISERSTIAPEQSKEETATFPTWPCPPINQPYVHRPLQHALNTRIAPTITITARCKPEDRHFFGVNRPEQTGESHDVGFRTSVYASSFDLILNDTLTPTKFTPGPDVATPNKPGTLPTCTTKVDLSYPFCEPSTRPNTTLDHYHLLLSEKTTRNSPQVFTILGVQECGKFMHKGNQNLPMGPFHVHVYRSWSFAQRQRFEEFFTDDGIPYYYDRRTGETYWERPLVDVEKLPVRDGGVRVDDGDDLPGGDSSKKSRAEIRKFILRHQESDDDILTRRRTAAHAIEEARKDGSLPPPPAVPTDAANHDHDDDQAVLQRRRSSSSSRRRSSSARRNSSLRPKESPQQQPEPQPPRKASHPSIAPPTTTTEAAMVPALPLDGPTPTTQSEERRPSSPLSEDGNNAAETIAAALLPALESQAEKLSGTQGGGLDMLKFGLGLGMGLGASGMVQGLLEKKKRRPSMVPVEPKELGPEDRMPSEQVDAARAAKERAVDLGFPIGVPDPTMASPEWELLDHSDEAEQREAVRRDSQDLTTTDKYKGVDIVGQEEEEQSPQQLTTTPDERPLEPGFRDSQEDIERTVPVVAHPDCVRGYKTHGAAGEAIHKNAKKNVVFVGSSKADGSLLRRAADPLPEGFFQAIHARRVAPAKCDYLPWIPNLPTAKPVGRLKPRSAALDWLAVGFDPWSAGKEPLTTEFVQSLASKVDAIANTNPDGRQAPKGQGVQQMPPPQSSVADASFIDVMDRHGLAIEEAEKAQANKLADDFALLTSWARHGKYREIEDAMNQPDWLLPIDYQDQAGNTLLSIAVQNGNKRIAKLCLRRGANINISTNNGQTVLHYAYAYGFESLADYLKSKGADDTILNVDGLTCYEGLSLNELEQI